MTEKHWAFGWAALLGAVSNIAIISLILQNPKPAFGDRSLLTLVLVVFDVVLLAKLWATWHSSRSPTSQPDTQSSATRPKAGHTGAKARDDPSLGFAFFALLFFLFGAITTGGGAVIMARPQGNPFPLLFRWTVVPVGIFASLFFLLMVAFVVRFIIRALWRRWKIKW